MSEGPETWRAGHGTLLLMRLGWTMLARGLLAGAALSCTSPIKTQRQADAGLAAPDAVDASSPQSDPSPVPTDAGTAPDVPAARDTTQAMDGAQPLVCAVQTVDPLLIPVRGTVRGPTVEGEVCANGVGTFFLGPEDTNHNYDQDFFTNTWLDAPYSPTGYDSSQVYGFLITKPADALWAVLTGWTGATAAEVGAYDSATNCGYLDFEVTLPVPPDVFCTKELAPCDPGCEGVGEMWVCEPANPILHYWARPSAVCGTNQDPAVGSWVLTLTAVSPYIPGDGYKHHETHGNLTATLVNQADPSDSVVLSLDF